MSDPQTPVPPPEPPHGAAGSPPPPPYVAPGPAVPPPSAPYGAPPAGPNGTVPPQPPHDAPPTAPSGAPAWQPPVPQYGQYAAPARPPVSSYGAPAAPPAYGQPGYPGGHPGYPGAQPAFPGAWTATPTVVRPLRGVGAAARWLIVACAAVTLITAGVEAWGIGMLSAFDAGTVGIEALDSYDAVSGLLAFVALAAILAAAVVWLVWQHRAASSLPPGSLRRSPGWHVGSWFIPIVSLIFPIQNVTDLARGSRARLSGGILGAWWALWIVSGIVSGIGSRLSFGASSVSALSGALATTMLGDVLLVGAAVFAWIVVARITDAIDPIRR